MPLILCQARGGIGARPLQDESKLLYNAIGVRKPSKPNKWPLAHQTKRPHNTNCWKQISRHGSEGRQRGEWFISSPGRGVIFRRNTNVIVTLNSLQYYCLIVSPVSLRYASSHASSPWCPQHRVSRNLDTSSSGVLGSPLPWQPGIFNHLKTILLLIK